MCDIGVPHLEYQVLIQALHSGRHAEISAELIGTTLETLDLFNRLCWPGDSLMNEEVLYEENSKFGKLGRVPSAMA
jgi:hypothetical protein